MLDLLQRLLTEYGYLVVALAVMAEGAGVPLPGETLLLLGGAYAGAGLLNLPGVIVAAALGAIAGDNLGYWIGRRGGRPLLARYLHLVRLDVHLLTRVESFYARHGVKTVFFARFLTILRTLSALLAGASHMPYGRFVVWNAAGGTLWAVVMGLLGAAFGSQWPRLVRFIGRTSLVVAVVVLLALLVARLRRRTGATGGFLAFLRARFSPEGYLGLQLTAGVLLVVLAGALFAGIAEDVLRQEPLVQLDRALADTLHTRLSPHWTAVMRVASFAGKPATLLVAGLALVVWFARRRRRGDLLLVVLAVGGGEMLNPLLKLLFARQRPSFDDPLVMLKTFSFPSGHATGSMIFYGLLVYFAVRAGGPWGRRSLAIAGGALAILLIGWSRLYLGAHYLSDVLGGWAVGLVWLASTITAVGTWRRRRRVLALRPGEPGAGAPEAQGLL
jgi:membrane protein DedA with SNARE-associated domain/membrane-associated phospholipid phosphatase